MKSYRKTPMNTPAAARLATFACAAFVAALMAVAAEDKGKQPPLEPIPLELPRPAFKGTPKHAPPGTRLEQPRTGPRPPFLAPRGVRLLSRGKPVTMSDPYPIIGEAKYVTDGVKEATEGAYVELGPGLQWVQIDLQNEFELHAVVVWHFHLNARVYHDVIIQASTDPEFKKDVRTLWSNDHDNSSGLGVGEEYEYWETNEGRLIDAGGVKARYVRCYSNGSIEDEMNHYVEVEVFGLPAK